MQESCKMLAAFEPLSCALAACALEHVCTRRHRTPLPTARVWLKRNCESLLEAAVQEATEPILDIVNLVDARLMLASLVLLLVLRAVLAQTTERRGQCWVI